MPHPFKDHVDMNGNQLLNAKPQELVGASIVGLPFTPSDIGKFAQLTGPPRRLLYGSEVGWVEVPYGGAIFVSPYKVWETPFVAPPNPVDVVHVALTVSPNEGLYGPQFSVFSKVQQAPWRFTKIDGIGYVWPGPGLTYPDYGSDGLGYKMNVSFYDNSDPMYLLTAGVTYYYKWEFRRDIVAAPFYETYFTVGGRFVR